MPPCSRQRHHLILLLLLLLLLLGCQGAPFQDSRIPISVMLDSRAEKAESIFRRFNVSAVIKGRKPYEVLLFLCARLRTRSFPFVGSYNQNLASYLRSFTSRYQVPYFTWDDTPPPSPVHADIYDYEGRRRRRRRRRRSDWNFGRTPGPPFIVSVRPDLTFALRSFIKVHKWKRFGYVYTSDSGFERLQHLLRFREHSFRWDPRSVGLTGLEYLGPNGVKAAAGRPPPGRRHGSAEERIYSRLKHLDEWLRDLDVRNIVLDVNGKGNILRLLRVLQNLGMMRQEYHYLILDFGIAELPLSPYQFCGVNISGFQLLDYNNAQHVHFMRKWAKHTELLGMELHEIALLQDALSLSQIIVRTKLPLGWALPSTRVKCFEMDMQIRRFMNYSNMRPWPSAQRIVQMLTTTQFQGITGTLQFDENFNRQNYSVNIIQYNGRLGNSVKMGTWYHMGDDFSENTSHTIDEKESLPANKTFRVVSILQEPFLKYVDSVVHPPPKKGKKYFKGYCADLAEEIFLKLKEFGYDYDIQLVEDGQFGKYNRINKTWDGMVGDVLSNKADIIIAPLTISSERARFLYFSEPFMTFGLSILMKKPEKTKPGTFSFMYPLSNYLWLAITASCVSIGVGLYLIARISPFEWEIPEEHHFTLSNCLWFSLAAFVQQGVPFSPTAPSARIFSSMWWMFSIVIMAYYTANLAAFLTVERLIKPINNAKDLEAKYKVAGIEFGVLKSGSTYEFFKTSKLHPYDSLYKTMTENPSWYVQSTQEGIARVRKSSNKYAFIMESKMSEYNIHRQPCDTMMAEDVFGNKEYGIAVPRNREGMDDLRDKLNHAVLKLREDQKLQHLNKEWWIDRGNCVPEAQSSASRSLSLVNVSGVFYILIVGLVLAMLWAIVETSCAYATRRQRRKFPKLTPVMPRYAMVGRPVFEVPH